MTIPKLLVATTNAGKLKEFKEILGNSLFQVIGPREIEIEPTDIIETGKSYTRDRKSVV